jgi:XTP/dITP diphosphohydrolase
MDWLLNELKDVPDGKRGAYFHCTIYSVVPKNSKKLENNLKNKNKNENESFCVEGKCGGIITHEKIGGGGFGYDPIFYYPQENRTFGQMSSEEKNKFSHRAAAAELFAKKIVKYI